jgi:hypothetical protein
LRKALTTMQYQIFVENQAEKHFVASVMGMSTIAVNGNTELEAIDNAKAALQSQLAKGKIVTINIDDLNSEATPLMQHAGILQADPTFDDWVVKLAAIRQAADEIDD